MAPVEGSTSNPSETANWFSYMFFCWVYPIFKKGYKDTLNESDIPPCPKVDRSEHLRPKLERHWNTELQNLEKKEQSPHLLRAILKTFAIPFSLNCILIFIEECVIKILQPFLLGYIVDYFNDERSSIEYYQAWLCAVSLCLLAAIMVGTHHRYYFNANRFAMKIRIALCAMMYNKAIRLNRSSLRQTTVGQMVNLLTNDVNRFEFACFNTPYLLVGPLQVLIILLIIWKSFSPYLLIGLLLIPLYIVFQMIMSKYFSKYRGKTAKLTDERIRLMNELVAGIRVIKMYAWEFPFAEHVDQARRKEIRKILWTSILRGINVTFYFITYKLILFLSFLTFVLMQGHLEAKAVFVCLALFNCVRLTMTLSFPNGISYGAEALISIKRIQTFLLLEEQDESLIPIQSSMRPQANQCSLTMTNVTAFWNKEIDLPTIQRISTEIYPGELLIVVGAVGSGKSSLLMSLLGELPIESGDISIKGKLSYCSQEPWVLAGSLKENILFGRDYDSEKYHKVIQLSSLDKDLEELPYGDETYVGDRGVSLSGGQKARVNLARALYDDADIFLIDDPLSAVDPAVAKHIFEKCIDGFLKTKIRILCTHQIQFLRQATKIIVLCEGRIEASGTYQDLIVSGVDFGALQEDYDAFQRRPSNIPSSPLISEDNVAFPLPILKSSISKTSAASSKNEKGKPEKIEEMRTKGNMDFRVYYGYVKAGAGIFMQLLLPLGYIATQAVATYSDFFLKEWTDLYAPKYFYNDTANETLIIPDGPRFDDEQNHYIYIYTILIGVTFVLALFRTLLFFATCMKSSINLHNNMFRCLIRAPVSFFDRNPAGNILNRCTRDMGIIDDIMPIFLSNSLEIFCNVIGTLLLVTIIQPYLLIPSLATTFTIAFMRNYYLATARDVKRLEGTTRSPVYTHLTSSMQGLATLRAYKAQSRFSLLFDQYQDTHSATWFIFMSSTRWLGVCIDVLCVAYITAVTFVLMFLTKENGGGIGLAIASVINLSGQFQWGVRLSAEVENHMVSVERVLEFSTLESESELEAPKDKKPPPNWPDKGEIQFQNVSLNYNPNDLPVLKELHFKIEPSDKIGIVGRTGAGKSSILTALFRMTEPAGKIIIDRVLTSDIGLHDLRKSISIIPQDPVLFTGTVRRNLDPFSEHTDDILWGALSDAYLKEVVEELPGGLDSQVSEGGSNFSVGQRQLICLARAVLRQNKILMLDEATANVDPYTDNLIQETIRTKFKECTVITIAHRLHTVMDSDKVLVLDQGTIKEYDVPYHLLQNSNGAFYEMVETTGPKMSVQLRTIAEKKHFEKMSPDKNKALDSSQDLPETLQHNEADEKLNYSPELNIDEKMLHDKDQQSNSSQDLPETLQHNGADEKLNDSPELNIDGKMLHDKDHQSKSSQDLPETLQHNEAEEKLNDSPELNIDGKMLHDKDHQSNSSQDLPETPCYDEVEVKLNNSLKLAMDGIENKAFTFEVGEIEEEEENKVLGEIEEEEDMEKAHQNESFQEEMSNLSVERTDSVDNIELKEIKC